jgi:NAD(P)-dependent dehydrogenase (short-subunit alcohol dehydrogenase family)
MTAWSSRDVPELPGSLFVITGGNSGIGWEAAKVLADRKAEVVLACRNADKARGAVEAITSASPGARVSAMSLDLASLKSVRAFAAELAEKHGRLDVLINNAGLMAIPKALTEDGFEMQLGVNHLGHFALTGLLVPLLEKSRAPRVVNLASQAHRMGKMNFDDLMSERRYDRWVAYGQSKLANLLFTFELGRRLAARMPALKVSAAHPGYAATNLQSQGAALGGSQLEGWVMKLGNGILAQSAAAGALPTLRAAVDPEAASGDYFGPRGIGELAGPPVKVGCTARARDPEAARQLWARSVELTGVDPGGA